MAHERVLLRRKIRARNVARLYAPIQTKCFAKLRSIFPAHMAFQQSTWMIHVKTVIDRFP